MEDDTMTATMLPNGKIRKSLAEQIDRLDTILDGLADGLSGAVADAVRETVGRAVQEAIQAVMTELLTNPAILAKLQGDVTAPAPAKPAPPDRVAQVTSQVRAWATSGWAKVRRACSATVQLLGRTAGAVRQQAQLAWAFRIPLLIAVGTGLATGAVAFVAGPWIAATAGSLAGFTTTTAVQLGINLRRMLARFASSSD
jgi:hypothetical protein